MSPYPVIQNGWALQLDSSEISSVVAVATSFSFEIKSYCWIEELFKVRTKKLPNMKLKSNNWHTSEGMKFTLLSVF